MTQPDTDPNQHSFRMTESMARAIDQAVAALEFEIRADRDKRRSRQAQLLRRRLGDAGKGALKGRVDESLDATELDAIEAVRGSDRWFPGSDKG